MFTVLHYACQCTASGWTVCAFGKVVEGLDVVDKIASVRTGWQDKPVEEQKIQSMTVELFGETYPEPEKC